MAKKEIAEHLREINTGMSELTPAGEDLPTDNSEAQEESDPENNDMVEISEAQDGSEQNNNVDNSAAQNAMVWLIVTKSQR
jgi:hypothetical protein